MLARLGVFACFGVWPRAVFVRFGVCFDGFEFSVARFLAFSALRFVRFGQSSVFDFARRGKTPGHCRGKASIPQIADKFLIGLIAVQVMAYLFFSLQKLREHRKHLEIITAAPDDFRLNWLLYFLLGFDVLMLFWLYETLLPNFRHEGGWQTIVYFLAICGLTFFVMRQKEVFPFSEKNAAEIREFLTETEQQPAVKRALLSEERLLEMKSSLLKKMETQKPYLDPELNLPTLAGQLDLSLNELSELVNRIFGENFNQFVNRYRVEESKRLLISEKHAHLSMVGIAFEAGFNSKTAFNTTFKKMTGLAPTDFKNTIAGSFQ